MTLTHGSNGPAPSSPDPLADSGLSIAGETAETIMAAMPRNYVPDVPVEEGGYPPDVQWRFRVIVAGGIGEALAHEAFKAYCQELRSDPPVSTRELVIVGAF